MTQEELIKLLSQLRKLPSETEWVEFKVNNSTPKEIGEYISALSNSACLWNKEAGYLVFGVKNETHQVAGTVFQPRKEKIGNEELENWIATQLDPRIDFTIHEFVYDGKNMVLFRVQPALNVPVKFKGTAFVRVGSYKKKLDDHPEKARKIWKNKQGYDWSVEICEGAEVSDLDPQAILKARDGYKIKYPALADDAGGWDDITFLNKSKACVQGKITRAAIILLGKSESEHFIKPAIAKISWILKDDQGHERDYEHFGPPFILNTDAALEKIRNLKYRYLPANTLFPVEITQYEPYVIREALHNCIAHQDYESRSRVVMVEKPDELIFDNAGSFLPGSVESVIEQDAPQKYYRNQFLAAAMASFNMIDIIGGGIKKMFELQRKRFFPMPSYILDEPNEVKVRITGKLIDENYTRLLTKHTDLDLHTIILLDKVQKREKIGKFIYGKLKKRGLIEGRYPNLYVVSEIASITEKKAAYIKNRAFDKDYYKKLIISFVEKYGAASRQEIDDLLMSKLSDALNEKQRRTKINNLLNEMANRDKRIKNIGSDRKPRWILA